MSDDHALLQVAARGWCHPGWQGDFYPEDLPEDWRLAYYANEFRAAVVPAAYWETADTLEVERWSEDTSEQFVFYLEVADLLTDWDRFNRLLAPLFTRTGGVLLRPSRVDADLTLLLPVLEGLDHRWPVSLIMPEGMAPSDAGHDLLDEWGVDLCWSVGHGEPDWRHSVFSVARVAGNLAYTPKEWREIIERCLRDVGTGSLLVMLEGEPPAVNSLRAATLIGELLAAPGSSTEP